MEAVYVPVTTSTNYPSLREVIWTYEWEADSIEFEKQPLANEFWKGVGELGRVYETFRFLDGVLRFIP